MSAQINVSLFEALFRHSSEMTALLDAEGRVLAVNPATIRLLSEQDRDIVGRAFWECSWMAHNSDEHTQFQKKIAECASGHPCELESSLQGADEEFLFVEISLAPLRGESGEVEIILLNARDVTAHHRLREALAFRSEFEAYISDVSATFINLPSAEIDHHVEQHLRDVCLYTATSVAYIFRYSEDRSTVSLTHLWKEDDLSMPPKEAMQALDVENTPWRTERILSGEAAVVRHVDELPAEAKAEAAAMKQMGVVSEIDIPLVYQDRVIGFMGISGRQTFPDWDEDIIALLSIIGQVFTNAIIRKESAGEQRQLEHQLRQAQKMEAIGLLAGGIAHDFNNFLQAIHGYSDLILSGGADEKEIRDDVEQIRNVSQQAAGLTRQLLAFSRRQVISPEVLDMEEIVGTMVRMLRRLLGERVELVVKAAGSVQPVYVDRHQMEQVLLNLCVNARDAIVDRGTITIELSSVHFDAAFCRAHPWAEEGHYTSLFVRDNGTGLPDEIAARVFEPFFTTKETGKGTGLGLSTVYGIVSQSKGLIHLESELGVGTVFQVYLPAAVSDRVVEDDSVAVTEGGKEHILLAEDNDSVRRSAVRILEAAGYSVVAATNGVEAFELFKKHEARLQLAVLDVVMPLLGGFELRQRLAESKPDMKFLMVSGYSDESVNSANPKDEGLLVLSKPFGREELLREVRRSLDS